MENRKFKGELMHKKGKQKKIPSNYVQVSKKVNGKIVKEWIKITFPIGRTCRIKNCGRELYAKGFCNMHYERLRRTGSLKRLAYLNQDKVCKVHGCDNPAKARGYCSMHYCRWQKHRSSKKPPGPRGKENGNWRGGVSQYPNHYLLKKNRLIRLEEENYRCEFCSKKTNTVFHKDGSKSNHSRKNLSVACRKCGLKHFRNPNSTSKYLRKYGITLREMVKRYGRNSSHYTSLHKRGKLRKFLRTPLEE